MNEELCAVCGRYNTEAHHIIYRSHCPSLVHCHLNIIYLCPLHHRSERGVHGKYGNELNRKLKLDFQNKLEMLFDKEWLTEEEVNEVLQISEKSLKRLLKTLKKEKGIYYHRDSVILACMGGKLIE